MWWRVGNTIKVCLLDNKSTEWIKYSVQGTLCVAFKIKRDDLDKPLDADDKKLLNQSGIYFLFGETSDKSSKEIVYIGQAGVRKNGKALLNRIKEHSRKKRLLEWSSCIYNNWWFFWSYRNKLFRTSFL